MQKKNRIFFVILIMLSSQSKACDIIGFIGDQECKEYLLEGFDRIKYRGYDAAGFASIHSTNGLWILRSSGEYEKLKSRLELVQNELGSIGIGHVRWGIHSISCENEIHPHTDCTKSIALVHTGLIKNFAQLKNYLQQNGHLFKSTIDSEIIAHMLEQHLKDNPLPVAVRHVLTSIEGSCVCLAICSHYPQTMIVMRKNDSPLLWVGIEKNKMFFASHPSIYSSYSNKGFWMPENSFALATSDLITLYDEYGQIISDNSNLLGSSVYQDSHSCFDVKKNDLFLTLQFYQRFVHAAWNQLGCLSSVALEQRNKDIFSSFYRQSLTRQAQFFFTVVSQLEPQIFQMDKLMLIISPIFACDCQQLLLQFESSLEASFFASLLISSSYLLANLRKSIHNFA